LRTIQRAELADSQTSLTFANNLAVRRALESAGVEFTNGDQPGVRLSKAAVAAHSAVVVSRASRETDTTKPVRAKTAKAAAKKP
jgi:hypothetical protein